MSEHRSPVSVLRYYRYLGPDSDTDYSDEDFCGECFRHLASPTDFPKFPEDLEKDNKELLGSAWHGRHDRELEFYSFCPWCGVAFEDEWWKNQSVQNERAIDHYKNPGTHRGDTHEFVGGSPDCAEGHWLATTGHEICWCDPDVEPGLLGCKIRHKNKSYEEYREKQRQLEEAWADDDDV